MFLFYLWFIIYWRVWRGPNEYRSTSEAISIAISALYLYCMVRAKCNHMELVLVTIRIKHVWSIAILDRKQAARHHLIPSSLGQPTIIDYLCVESLWQVRKTKEKRKKRGKKGKYCNAFTSKMNASLRILIKWTKIFVTVKQHNDKSV